MGEQIKRTFEPHTNGEFIAAPSRTTPFQERAPQPGNLVYGEQVTRRYRNFRHQFNPSQ
ncbi:hypothetical protein ABTX99_34550 [Streptomyces flaveolus]|uniref:hypothetical protein n=1 Tax=Streptomyces flaveolus TaxID=67297 RepID=UPI00332F578B